MFPVHPRTAARLAEHGLDQALARSGILLVSPLPYIRFMSLVSSAAAVVTDSGGLQEETTYLGIPCLTLRDSTERPITIEQGTNRLATPENAAAMLDAALASGRGTPRRPEYWDGNTASRCLEDLKRRSGLVLGANRRAAA